ncbi:MAG: glycosyltransferase family 4 protein [Chloroflexota bacterium]
MRLLYIADGRSPTARNWISYFIQTEHEVHLVSTSPCADLPGLASLHVLPVAFSQVGIQGENKNTEKSTLRRITPLWARTLIRQWLGPFTLGNAARQLSEIIEEINPDLIHAMRIPYEGMLAVMATPKQPLIVSVWGNDFTLHARSNPVLGRYTRRTVKRVTALHTDCQRDLTLASNWGFPAKRLSVVLPGSGGVRKEVFYPPEGAPASAPPVIINPRGFRAYIRNDTFFKAIPLVLKEHPKARFLCPTMDAHPEAHRYVEQLGIGEAVDLQPMMPQNELAEQLRSSHIVVSPSTHDGTPNSLLEAIACGCFPVAGNIESIHEWIRDGENGLLVDPGDPKALAEAIITAIADRQLNKQARETNFRLINEFAAYDKVMPQASHFYQEVWQAAYQAGGSQADE